MNVITVKERYKDDLMALPNVVGVGVGHKLVEGERAQSGEVVTVMVEHKLPLAALAESDVIPRSLLTGNYNQRAMAEYINTDVIQVGQVRALPGSWSEDKPSDVDPVEYDEYAKNPTDKWRPAPGGVSIGHYRITAGTFGCVVKDKGTGRRLILSNNHVLADSNNGMIGDIILQPGPHDGGSEPGDKIGTLGRFVRIDFGEDDSVCPFVERFVKLSNFGAKLIGSSHKVSAYQSNPQAVNYVDAAYAIPTDDQDILDVIWGGIGVPNGVAEGFLGMEVAKYGRTTLYTEDRILLSNATIRVSYGGLRIATFENQFVAGPMSAGGDSGSLVIEKGTTNAVGLLFAGSDQSTIFSPIQFVLEALDVEF